MVGKNRPYFPFDACLVQYYFDQLPVIHHLDWDWKYCQIGSTLAKPTVFLAISSRFGSHPQNWPDK
jgi:hypothetical protein